jgi:hypothetical protein
MLQQTVSLKKVLGDNHPDMIVSINNLVIVLEGQGKYAEAEKLRQQGKHAQAKTL